MVNLRRSSFFLIPVILLLGAPPGRAQGPTHSMPSTGRGSMGGLNVIEKQDWRIFGRVLALNGEGVSGAKVRMDIGGGIGSVQEAETDMLGRFTANFNLNVREHETLRVKLLVSKSNYQDARALVEFPQGKTWEIDVTMLGINDDPNQLSQDDLIGRVGTRLRTARDELPDSARKKYEEGVAGVLKKRETVKSAAGLEQLASKQPACVDCAALASLAFLEAGDWSTATKQAAAARESNLQSPHPRPEPLLILGVMESWKGAHAKAASFFLEALKYQPNDPMALEELGRTQLLANNDEAAEEYLAKAVSAGAPPEARLLRVRALLGMNDFPTASEEMDKYIAGREIKVLPPHARLLYSQLQGRLELAAYGHVKSLLTQPIGEIEKAAPELKLAQVAANQDELPAVLQKVGKSVADFFSNFPDTVSIEHVQQETLKKDDKLADRSTQTFRYLLVAKPGQKGLGLEEYRTNDLGQESDLRGLDKGFMLTAGFASTSLYFHPAYQSGADFRLLGTQAIDGQRANVVVFAQNPNRAVITELFHGDRDTVLILVQGIAWIDAASGHILRMRTDLLKPATKVRLARQTTEIAFSPVQFKQVSKEFWLPREVVVTVDWKGRKFRNEHGYSDFKLFNVKAEENRKTSELQNKQQGPGK
jgi:tetratricopeptide (TPR) repeat protein